MGNLRIIIVVIILGRGLAAYGDDYVEKDSGLKSSTPLVEKILNMVPNQPLRDGLKDYIKTVNPDAYSDYKSVGNSNAGLREYFENRFSDNQCFQNAARDFYQEVGALSKKSHPCGSSAEFDSQESDYGCYSSKLSIDDTAGRGLKSNVSPGWLLKLAMKHANNNLPAALELIAMCGHDDKEQGSFFYQDTSAKGIAAKNNELAKYTAARDAALQSLKNLGPAKTTTPEARRFRNQIENLNDSIQDIAQQRYSAGSISCPQSDADFFLPGSLTKGAKIPEELAQKVKWMQAADRHDAIPPKEYHINASAFLGCKMAQKGIYAPAAARIQTLAARVYRGVRMCGVSQKLFSERQEISHFVKDFENSKSVETQLMAWWDQKNQSKLRCGMDGLNEDGQKKCEILDTFGIANLTSSERAVAEKKIATGSKRMDAADLYRKWYIGGGVVHGQQLPCTDARYRGPQDLMNPGKGMFDWFSQPKGWSKDRYDAASKELASWDIDFKWTVAQHAAGAEFGARSCEHIPPGNNPFEKPGCEKGMTVKKDQSKQSKSKSGQSVQ